MGGFKKKKLFIKFAECFGVKIFKKYWVVRGSYWNRKHIDKNQRPDLETIINEANEFTKTHVEQWIGILILIFILTAVDLTRYWEYAKLAFAMSLYHGYAFMVHHYNRLLAQERLSSLPVIQPHVYNETNVLSVKNRCGDHIYSIEHSKTWERYGPFFATKERAEKFLSYLLDQVDNDKNRLLDLNYTGKTEAYYTEFINKDVS